jgi:type I restriction enzyme, R subunit
VCKRRAKVSLADGKARTIQHMVCTTFWHPDGTPISAQQFMEMLFGRLPEFFKDEDELRSLWSVPDTRKKLLLGLAEKGFGHEQLGEMQKIINAEKSDLFDVLAYVAYALPPLNREERADRAKAVISTHFNSKQGAFLDFVLAHYVSVGVEELHQEKLTPLLGSNTTTPFPMPWPTWDQRRILGRSSSASRSTSIRIRLASEIGLRLPASAQRLVQLDIVLHLCVPR